MINGKKKRSQRIITDNKTGRKEWSPVSEKKATENDQRSVKKGRAVENDPR